MRIRLVPDSGAEGSVFNGGLIDQHDRYIIPDRIEAMALHTAQAAIIGLQFQITAAGWANKNLKQFRTDRHNLENTSLTRCREVGSS